MSAMVMNQPGTNTVIEGAIPIPLTLPQSFPSFTIPITAPGLHYELEAPLIEKPILKGSQFIISFSVDEHVMFTLTLTGKQLDGQTRFQASHYILHCKVTEQRARPHFVAATVLAVFGFAGKIGLKIPEFGISSYLDFNPPLAEISNFLQRRQIAYRLMTVERAVGIKFPWPQVCTYEELEFLHRGFLAITERSFVGPIDPVGYKVPALKELLSWLDSYKNSPTQTYGPLAHNMNLFGQIIEMGKVRIVVADAYIQDADKVRHELEANDGHLVEVVISSASGQGLYETPDAPRLDANVWEPKIKTLIALEQSLDDTLVERYHALATATLAGASEDRKRNLTARPKLDEDAFLLGN
jgi:hypothetical protein